MPYFAFSYFPFPHLFVPNLLTRLILKRGFAQSSNDCVVDLIEKPILRVLPLKRTTLQNTCRLLDIEVQYLNEAKIGSHHFCVPKEFSIILWGPTCAQLA